jgi:hypothetical protein
MAGEGLMMVERKVEDEIVEMIGRGWKGGRPMSR